MDDSTNAPTLTDEQIAAASAAYQVRFAPHQLLIPYARNVQIHDEIQVGQIASSIEEFGFVGAVAADDKGILAGHGRTLAAERLYKAGKTIRAPNGAPIPHGTVPWIDCSGWSEAQRRAYIIIDNQLTRNAGVNQQLLAVEVADLKALDFDLTLLGFDDAMLQQLLAPAGTEGETDPDEVPEPPVEPVTRPGDVWRLGRHRILCGDSTVATDVERVLAGAKPHLMVTDPPYGVEYDATWRGAAGHAKLGNNRTGIVAHDDRADWREAWALFPGSIAYVWHAGLMAGVVADSLAACDFKLRSQIIWNKTVMAMGRGDYHWKHEPCWYAVKGTGDWRGDRKQTTVWDFASPIHIMSGSKEEKTPHPTQKPVECMKRPIENNSAPGDGVYEPFAGSSTTVIACEMTGRHCFAIELNPQYVDVGIVRWQNFTGQQAVLEETGQTFDEVSRLRVGADVASRSSDLPSSDTNCKDQSGLPDGLLPQQSHALEKA